MTPDWQADALCSRVDNPEIFYPEPNRGHNRTHEAKKICHHCQVQPQCLHYALQHQEHFGIWGGTSEHERRHLRNQGAA